MTSTPSSPAASPVASSSELSSRTGSHSASSPSFLEDECKENIARAPPPLSPEKVTAILRIVGGGGVDDQATLRKEDVEGGADEQQTQRQRLFLSRGLTSLQRLSTDDFDSSVDAPSARAALLVEAAVDKKGHPLPKRDVSHVEGHEGGVAVAERPIITPSSTISRSRRSPPPRHMHPSIPPSQAQHCHQPLPPASPLRAQEQRQSQQQHRQLPLHLTEKYCNSNSLHRQHQPLTMITPSTTLASSASSQPHASSTFFFSPTSTSPPDLTPPYPPQHRPSTATLTNENVASGSYSRQSHSPPSPYLVVAPATSPHPSLAQSPAPAGYPASPVTSPLKRPYSDIAGSGKTLRRKRRVRGLPSDAGAKIGGTGKASAYAFDSATVADAPRAETEREAVSPTHEVEHHLMEQEEVRSGAATAEVGTIGGAPQGQGGPVRKSSYHSRKSRTQLPSLAAFWGPGEELDFRRSALRSGRTPSGKKAARRRRNSETLLPYDVGGGSIAAGAKSTVGSVDDDDNNVKVAPLDSSEKCETYEESLTLKR